MTLRTNEPARQEINTFVRHATCVVNFRIIEYCSVCEVHHNLSTKKNPIHLNDTTPKWLEMTPFVIVQENTEITIGAYRISIDKPGNAAENEPLEVIDISPKVFTHYLKTLIPKFGDGTYIKVSPHSNDSLVDFTVFNVSPDVLEHLKC